MLISYRIFATAKAESIKSLLVQARNQLFRRHKTGFAAAMTEALEKHTQQKAEARQQREAELDAVKEIKMKKRNMKKRKWVDWNTQDEEAGDVKRPPFDPADRVKRKKTAILLGYSGANYFGMQRNPGMQTIEEELFKTLLKHKWITDDSFEQAQIACFQRAARTDKGVSAARQVCSIKLPDTLDIKAFNEDLPEQIRLFGAERVTKGFNAKDQCNARTYTYTLPTVSFANHEETPEYESYRLPSERQEKLAEVLQLFEGTKNFHNFTSRKNFLDPSAKRFIMSFACSAPFVSPQGIEFVTIKVKGQSFMLHQIRKMVGLVIAIVRGNTTTATLERALTEERLDLPMAPGLGLVLDTVHYERYNERYGSDGIHKPLTWAEQEAEIRDFIEKYIYANIYETEFKERPMIAWLETLSLHTYEPRTDEPNGNTEEGKDKRPSKADEDDDNEE